MARQHNRPAAINARGEKAIASEIARATKSGLLPPSIASSILSSGRSENQAVSCRDCSTDYSVGIIEIPLEEACFALFASSRVRTALSLDNVSGTHYAYKKAPGAKNAPRSIRHLAH
jgi:hypothetical protein